MIVQKAVSMAQRMDIPVLGMVENMRFIKCPDCGKEIPLFGSDDAVDSTNVPVLERIPLDPKVAAACDAGSLAQSDVSYLTKNGSDSGRFLRRKEKPVIFSVFQSGSGFFP